ncbi:DUF262 domain-containing protein [Ottowia sp.]|uniref:DUF262 domain-containing protein n=1 Tax=Ottowia sp. TaxID=1898956 RepID=UPI002B8ACDC5|nr:DUF262 domain-containing protein [Ottowia sp.]HOB67085.1 DUF262 domain-containing protein [Ottowia sp.]HPZ56289.1 DUF262 domain-containing protein [Ottowia sp.]HQD47532.1 DUF262 domain-containing protein [Ottowia sp.]
MQELQVPDDQQEDEGDITGSVDFRDAVVVSHDWTIETIYSQIKKENIDLQPKFQRRAAWDTIRKSRLIESIIVGMPVPNIVLAENQEQRGKFIVIDGKQRLVSIKGFIEDDFSLSGLDIRGDLNGKKYSDLVDDDRNNFDNSTLRSTVIKNWKDDNFLYAIFYRLNSGSLPLSPQELRKALTGGKLIDHIEDYLINSAEFKSLFGDELDKRMRDSELVLRFLAFEKGIESYQGNFKKFLDDTTEYFENDWSNKVSEADLLLKRLDRALATSKTIFGEDAFKKWTGDRYERVMNRAIFDAVARFFGDEGVAADVTSKREEVVEAFKSLCCEPEFKESVERTTKKKQATDYRIDAWGERLAAVLSKTYNQAIKEMA